MENTIDYSALVSKYLGVNSPIGKRLVNENNFFIEDCEEGFTSIHQFFIDLGIYSDDPNSRIGLSEFLTKLSEGKNFTPKDEKPDVAGNKYIWLSYYQGRQTLGFKLPSLPWTLQLLNTDRSVKFDLSLEALIKRAGEILVAEEK